MAILKAKRGSGVPSGLTAWEMAFDHTNGNFYIGNTIGSAILIGVSGSIPSNVVTSFNGKTGAVSGVCAASGNTFTALQAFTAGLCASGGVTLSGTISSDSGYKITSNAIKALTGTTYTFLSTDNGLVLTHNNASGCTMTIPSGLPVGFSTTLIRLNSTGRVGFTAASGVTLNSYGGFTGLAGQHASASLISYSSNIFNLAGNLI